ncbi:hypothetical protein E2C01_028139 [Portunus trituberculatus]|uniref:Uncharacterized protein n=1 Tax=Portunus trituberculatus TaxID=210409 RepID=A0A5B7EN33_PORTR|nr:hypothetical protein [Portunus trituberculatus]
MVLFVPVPRWKGASWELGLGQLLPLKFQGGIIKSISFLFALHPHAPITTTESPPIHKAVIQEVIQY